MKWHWERNWIKFLGSAFCKFGSGCFIAIRFIWSSDGVQYTMLRNKVIWILACLSNSFSNFKQDIKAKELELEFMANRTFQSGIVPLSWWTTASHQDDRLRNLSGRVHERQLPFQWQNAARIELVDGFPKTRQVPTSNYPADVVTQN